MRYILFLSLVLIPLYLIAQPHEGLPIIRAESRLVDVRMGDELLKQAWRIVPEASPDVLTVPCRTPDMQVAFYTDRDSIRYVVNPGDNHQFYILYEGQYALTEIKGVPYVKPAIFSDDYIEANRGRWTVGVPEVQELVHIIFALTPTGVADSNLVEHETDYYREVMKLYQADPGRKIEAYYPAMLSWCREVNESGEGE